MPASCPALPRPVCAVLRQGQVIPELPLALTAARRLDERRQRALCRYYAAAGAGGLAVGGITTQFAIRHPKHGMLRPVLTLAAEEMDRADRRREEPLVRIAGVSGKTAQAVSEAALARVLGYHAGLLSLAELPEEKVEGVLAHCQAVAAVLPLVGINLKRADGGRVLPFRFWRKFAEIEAVVAIEIAPFNRYQTIDVIRAMAEAGRDDIALYTGNDDTIVLDLVTPFRFTVGGRTVERRIVGGLPGHWSVWTLRAVELLAECRDATRTEGAVPVALLRKAAEITDANAAICDAAHNFAGRITGLHEVLRRQGLLDGTWCLDPREGLSPGQSEEIDRVWGAYPHLNDDAFVAAHRDEWLR